MVGSKLVTGQPIEHCGHNHKQHEAGLASIDPLGNKSFLFRSSAVWPYKFALPPPSFSSPNILSLPFTARSPASAAIAAAVVVAAHRSHTTTLFNTFQAPFSGACPTGIFVVVVLTIHSGYVAQLVAHSTGQRSPAGWVLVLSLAGPSA